MPNEDLLAELLHKLMLKEGPPPADENTTLFKTFAPNDSMEMDDNVTTTVSDPSTFVWGGNQYDTAVTGTVSTVYVKPGWKWGQGQWK